MYIILVGQLEEESGKRSGWIALAFGNGLV